MWLLTEWELSRRSWSPWKARVSLAWSWTPTFATQAQW